KKSVDGKMTYKVLRGNSVLEFYLQKNEQGVVGVMLAELQYNDLLKAKIYGKSVYYSLLEVKDVKLPFWQAPLESFKEMCRLSVLTAQMFVGVFEKLFTQLSVPEGVAGPVGIFQMTSTFVQEGVMSLIRFTAILSLSLAIINILPFPGLDGGRLFLIVVPLILRRKLNHKLEAIIHMIGFLILMFLIFLVTFNDILRLFGL
ncbi:site-2 protease family protein, partial [Candidatus Peregrinibacteria bacterium]|nr:site-2 protease family protein [Candidatus Peregrinibacteria bacterium]